MLVFATLFLAALLAASKLHITGTMIGVVAYTAARWALGDFLWCWLVADHLFSSIEQAHERGHLRDWRCTPLTPEEIVGGLQRSTRSFMLPAVLGAGVIDGLVPTRMVLEAVATNSDSATAWLVPLMVSVLSSLAVTVAHVGTLLLAARFLAVESLTRGGGPRAWLQGMSRLALLMLLTTAVPAALALAAWIALPMTALDLVALLLVTAGITVLPKAWWSFQPKPLHPEELYGAE